MTKQFEDLKLGDYVNFGHNGMHKIIAEDIAKADEMRFAFESNFVTGYPLKDSKFIDTMVIIPEYSESDRFEWVSNRYIKFALEAYPQGEC